MSLENRTLYFGDNLQVIEEKFPDNFFDLIYLDPPFNSNRNYNVLFKEGQVDASAQIRAFEDTWEWSYPTIRLFNGLKESNDPQIAIMMQSLFEIMRDTPMMAYLVNMTARLIPLRRVLKETGSIYLHCDPTASHYLKMIMDVIFGKQNFRNELIWCYTRPSSPLRQFPRTHDVILFYTKTNRTPFYRDAIRVPYDEETIARSNRNPGEKSSMGKKGKDRLNPLGKIPESWWRIPMLQGNSTERLGYPTQKPEALLERIIKASSKEGDWVLDPFCGCGTSVAVAERLNRNWIGIDISMQSVNVIMERMRNHFPGIKINIDGIPMDYESAAALAEKDKFAFQDWAITLVGANPPSGVSKKGADRGIDGIILFREKVDYSNPKLRKIIVQVKGGGTNRGDVARLKGDLEREDAPMGILITLKDATAEMKREAALSGEYQYTQATTFPRIQLLSIREWFEGKELKLPADTVNPFKKAESKKGADIGQLEIDLE
ncbi:MAG TPA: DNA methyltransferase [Anaerolineaceae bacterium]|nr:DNA methyltransferase [Anaerolineaceae bacterium]HQJ31913.1 DNA methyltransferase [Anaerolineaceae bacterium]